jgi:hypothetical protein
MRTTFGPSKLLAIGILSFAGLFLLLTGRHRAVLKAEQEAEKPKGPTKVYYGTSTCIDCHSKGTSQKDPVCLCTEANIWKKEDKHKNAYKILEDKRAQRMGKLLNIKVTEDKRCLTCHSVYIEDKELEKKSKEVEFKREEGVSCVACHGAYEEWVSEHSILVKRPNWRKKTREQKEKEGGMTDLWNPTRRAEVCASCHVGNTEQGKVITHDMYAAGHPPLPSFEIETFCEAMPAHWKLLAEKNPVAQKLLQYDSSQLERVKLVVEGGVAEFREAMQLLATQAKQNGEGDDSRRILDYAQYDCSACHHELRSPSWRQAAAYGKRTPGRPPMRPWPTALLKLGIRHAAQEDEQLYGQYSKEFETGLRELHQAFDARPFGVPTKIFKAADQLAKRADKLLKEMNKGKYDRAASKRFLNELCSDRTVLDYDSARQTLWAFKIIYNELQPKPTTDMKIPGILKALDESLHLQLPAGQRYEILKELDKMLRKMGEYKANEVSERLQDISRLLKAELR